MFVRTAHPKGQFRYSIVVWWHRVYRHGGSSGFVYGFGVGNFIVDVESLIICGFSFDTMTGDHGPIVIRKFETTIDDSYSSIGAAFMMGNEADDPKVERCSIERDKSRNGHSLRSLLNSTTDWASQDQTCGK